MHSDADKKVSRRGFLNAGLVAAGGAAGWLAGCDQAQPPAPTNRQPLGKRFTYDVSEYEKVEPGQLLFAAAGQIPTGLQAASCLAVGADDALYVGGDQVIKIFEKDGRPRSALALPEPPQALALDKDRVLVAFKDHFAIFDGAGQTLLKGEALGPRAHLTAIAATGEVLFVADAGNREVVRFDAAGKVLGRFGKLGSKDGNPGFVVPSPYFHLMIGSDGLLWVANPGRHQIQAHTLEGRFELGWGQPAMCVEGFCGCCNPSFFARLPDDRFITSERGLVRIKVYDAKGKFLGLVAGHSQLAQNDQNLPVYRVACDSAGRVLALDPITGVIRIFVPKADEPQKTPAQQK